jgi:hypothetical protein
MNLRRALLAAFALAALALLVPALAHAYYLQNADVAVRWRRRRSSSPRRSRSSAYHGAYRDIPLRRGESIDRISVAEGTAATPAARTKLGGIDRSDTFNYETNEKRVRIVWHFLAAGEPRMRSPTASRPDRRLRRCRRRESEGLGAELVRAAPD